MTRPNSGDKKLAIAMMNRMNLWSVLLMLSPQIMSPVVRKHRQKEEETRGNKAEETPGNLPRKPEDNLAEEFFSV